MISAPYSLSMRRNGRLPTVVNGATYTLLEKSTSFTKLAYALRFCSFSSLVNTVELEDVEVIVGIPRVVDVDDKYSTFESVVEFSTSLIVFIDSSGLHGISATLLDE